MKDWTAGEAFALGLAAGDRIKAEQAEEEAEAIASIESVILGQVDQIVAEESNTLWVAIRVISSLFAKGGRGGPGVAFMGLYTTQEAAQEVCQRNAKSTLRWEAEDRFETYFKTQRLGILLPAKADDPPAGGTEGSMYYVVSEQKVRT